MYHARGAEGFGPQTRYGTEDECGLIETSSIEEVKITPVRSESYFETRD